jgi:hypothetical protein
LFDNGRFDNEAKVIIFSFFFKINCEILNNKKNAPLSIVNDSNDLLFKKYINSELSALCRKIHGVINSRREYMFIEQKKTEFPLIPKGLYVKIGQFNI